MTRLLLALGVLLCACAPAQAATYHLSGKWKGASGTQLNLKQDGSGVNWHARAANGRTFAHNFTGEIQGEYITGEFTDEPGYDAYNKGSITAQILGDCRFKITELKYEPIDGSAGSTTEQPNEIFKKRVCDTRAPSVKTFPARGKQGEKLTLRFKVGDNSGEVNLVLAIWKGKNRLSRRDFGYVKVDGSTRTFTIVPRQKHVGTLEFWVIAVDRAGNRFASHAEVVVTH